MKKETRDALIKLGIVIVGMGFGFCILAFGFAMLWTAIKAAF